MKNLEAQKTGLLALIAITAASPLLFVPLDEPLLRLSLWKILAKTGSLVGTVLLVWQLLLGFRGFLSRVLPDLIWNVELHSYPIGATVRNTGLRYVWIALMVLVALIYLYRLAGTFGLLSKRYRVTRRALVGDEVTEVWLQPVEGRIVPTNGQFVYFRRGLLKGSHPYTVTEHDPTEGSLALTIKALGIDSRATQDIPIGEETLLDGPSGVFGLGALETGRPLVLIAGGIGITSFKLLVECVEARADLEAVLFFGNQRQKDIVYADYFESLKSVKVVHVLSDEPEYPGETGLVTMDLMRKYLKRDVREYEFLLCGPPPMIKILETDLDTAGVPPEQVHHELFSI